MSNEIAKPSGHPRIDLETVRETLAYIRDDMATMPEFANVKQALTKAIDEIARLTRDEAAAQPAQQPDARIIPFTRMNFVPWTARN